MQGQQNFSILLVDDDPAVIRVLSRRLHEFTPLRFATSGCMALKLARESVPDLMLLDIEMPELSGFEVCKAFKNDPALAQVSIILISSHDSLPRLPHLEEAGPDDLIAAAKQALNVARSAGGHQAGFVAVGALDTPRTASSSR